MPSAPLLLSQTCSPKVDQEVHQKHNSILSLCRLSNLATLHQQPHLITFPREKHEYLENITP